MMTKKTFEIPSIEKISFTLSDASMCAVANNKVSGLVSDAGVIQDMTGSQLGGMIG